MFRFIARCFAASLCWIAATVATAAPPIVTFNDDGGWCWFEDERSIIHDGKLIVGSVAAGSHDPSRRGNIEVVSYDLTTGQARRSVLHAGLQCDDHDSPALLVRDDGRLLAMYCRHGNDDQIRWRVSVESGDATHWQKERTFAPGRNSRVTYSNLTRLSKENRGRGRLFNFFRGWNNTFKPSWMTSDDGGQTWTAQGLWINFPAQQRHRPYVKYASDGQDTIHFVFTEGHPRDFDNSVYHAYYRNGSFFRSDGTKIKEVAKGPVTPVEATRVFSGDEQNVAWTSDLHIDSQGRPVFVYSVQKDAAGLGRGHADAGQDHRYRYARWDGRTWHDHEIAHAGTRLYKNEDDYTGNICLDPDAPETVYLSSNVNIETGRKGNSDRWEIYKGTTDDMGKSWKWTALTSDSRLDNIRPIVPPWNVDQTAVLWLRGRYNSFTDYDLDVVGVIMQDASSKRASGAQR